MGYRTWVEINEQALHANVRTMSSLIGPGVRLAAVVKANAYGHGLKETVQVLRAAGVDAFYVDQLEDAFFLRNQHPDILIMHTGHTPNEAIPEAIQKGIHLVIFDGGSCFEIERIAQEKKKKVSIHLKIDTGMSRLGFLPTDVQDFLGQMHRFSHLEVAGLMTHFADADDPTHSDYCTLQLERFEEALAALRERGFDPPLIHAANSAATILYPPTHATLVRVGLALYGLWPSESVEDATRKHSIPCELTPVLSWKTRIIQMKTVPPGTPVGYGRTEIVTRRSRIGILPVGYADGYRRSLSRVGHVLIQGTRCKILGSVCMNLMMVDMSHVPQVEVGSEVTLLGKGGPHLLGARELAKWLGTIEYEVVSTINPSIPRLIR